MLLSVRAAAGAGGVAARGGLARLLFARRGHRAKSSREKGSHFVIVNWLVTFIKSNFSFVQSLVH